MELGEASDLVIVDLDDVPPPSRSIEREAFDEQFAQLAFGLGTVRRRVHSDRASRTPLWVLLFAVIAMLAVLIGNPGSSVSDMHAVPSPRMLDVTTGAHVVSIAYDRIEAVDVDARVERVVRLAGIPDGTPTAVVAAGDSFAAVVHGRAYAVNRSLDRPAVDLGPADTVFRSASSLWVWLAVATTSGWQLNLVSPVTGERGPSSFTPARVGMGRPIGVLDGDGPVLDRVEDGRRVIGSATRSRAMSRQDIVLGMAGTSAVSLDCAQRSCTVVLTDLNARGDRRIDTAVPSGWAIGPSALGQDSGALAVLTNAPNRDSTRVLVVRSGVARVVDAGGHASALAWSGDWLFVTLDDGRLVAIGPAGGAETVDISPMPQGALVGS